MQIYTVIWKDQFVEKLAGKHGVEIEEVEEVLFIHPHVRLFEKDISKVKICTRLMDKQKPADIWLSSLF